MYAARSRVDSDVVGVELALGGERQPLANGSAALGPTPVARHQPRVSRDFTLFPLSSDQECP